MSDFAPLSTARRLMGGSAPQPVQLGRFELQRVLGQGAQATVWLALDPRLQRQVAIKVLPPVQGQGAASLEQWLREARHVGRLTHPCTVPVFEADVHGRQPYLVFEYVPGRTLSEHLAQQGRCAPHDAVALVADVLDGLQAAHAAGIVHRDLKPSNIMVDAQRHARVMDFGLAAAAGTVPETPSTSGSPAYMAPETADGAAPAPSMDIYAAALVLVELLTGQALIRQGDTWQTLYRITQESLTLPTDLGPGVDDRLRAIVLRALARDPAQRYATAGDFRDALRAWAAPVSAPTAAGNAALDFLLHRMRHKSDFPALSDSVARIQRVASSEDDSIADLTNEILKDVALTNKLLRLVNSVQFAHSRRDGGVSTVSRAVSLVGFNAVRNMALSLVLLEHMQNRPQAEQMREAFLRAMMAGCVAAELGGAALAEQAFIGAVFQNLGRMLCTFYFAEEAAQIRDAQAQGITEEAAAQKALGLTLEDLGAGVARVWGLPEALQACIRTPQGDPPQRAPNKGVEHLRWVARAANESAAAMLLPDPPAVAQRLNQLATQYARTLELSAQAVAAATLRARQQLVAMAQALDLQVPGGTAAARLLQLPAPAQAAAPDLLAASELGAQATQPMAAVPHPLGEPPPAVETAEILSAGIQDITNAMVDERFKLNDVLRMILETMLRALGARRIVFGLRDARSDVVTGRFGLGDDHETAVRALAVPLKATNDLFAAVCLKGADTLIRDATAAPMQERLPEWYRKGLNAPSFLLLPLQVKGRPFALIYADHALPNAMAVDDKALGLLRTLRNQAVMAFRQNA